MATLSVIGVDPGLKGALAWVNEFGFLTEIEDMPVVDNEVNANLLANLIVAYGPVECVLVERQQSFPKQGVASSFKTGTGYGIIIGVLAGLHVPAFYWAPSTWKKTMHLSSNKELSRKRALERWPDQSEYFKLKKHEGRAEAALLAATWWLSSERKELLPKLQGVPSRPNSRRRLTRRYPDGTVATVG
jgi:crossover junction endodeoxyribonuclease RuvC